ncbi:MAG: aminotransferase class III-fold pyridoxal phosphate-dependent enzyme [Deltaproteobacteria bacterium]|nr:aminotransferase class III-fold pyridoxal phosphate-dependent enzyme [Deltaproteobacteria bacterium]
MIERTQKERELIADAERIFPTSTRCLTFQEDLNFCVSKAKGSHIWDVSGNEYIDYLLGSGPHVLGHAHPAVLEALRTIPENGTSFLIINENAVALGKKIIEHVPCADMVSLHSSGSEATFFALRLARVYRKRDKILKFEGAYHGMHDYAMMSNQWTMGSPPLPQAVPNTHGIPRVLNDEVLIAPFNDLERTVEIISKHQDELAGVIIEPVQRTFEPKPGFLQGVREVTAKLDIPLIFDEVVTGFRLGLGGAQELYGVTPDLCALGKAISGGLPLGCRTRCRPGPSRRIPFARVWRAQSSPNSRNLASTSAWKRSERGSARAFATRLPMRESKHVSPACQACSKSGSPRKSLSIIRRRKHPTSTRTSDSRTFFCSKAY